MFLKWFKCHLSKEGNWILNFPFDCPFRWPTTSVRYLVPRGNEQGLYSYVCNSNEESAALKVEQKRDWGQGTRKACGSHVAFHTCIKWTRVESWQDTVPACGLRGPVLVSPRYKIAHRDPAGMTMSRACKLRSSPVRSKQQKATPRLRATWGLWWWRNPISTWTICQVIGGALAGISNRCHTHTRLVVLNGAQHVSSQGLSFTFFPKKFYEFLGLTINSFFCGP